MKYHLLMVVCIISVRETRSQSQDINIEDNCMPNVKILDLNSVMHPYSGETKSRYALSTSSKGSKYFEIRKEQLFTIKNIDIYKMCSDINECCDNNLDYCDLVITVMIYTDSETNVKTIKIHIVDVNDHPPIFPTLLKEIKLVENLKESYSTDLPLATDQDFGRNRVQTYQLGAKEPSSFDDYFSLHMKKDQTVPNDLTLRLNKMLDREVISFFSFELLAIDGGTSSKKTGTMSITIKVEDQNDNVPIFQKSLYKEIIKEGVCNDVPIVTLLATDTDEGENAKIEYRFSKSITDNSAINSNFRIESNGKIFLKKPLDYEKGNMYKFFVVATNPTPFNNARSTTSTATVEIEVENVHDEPLQIFIDYPHQKTWSQVHENSRGTSIAFITAISAETGSRNYDITCRLQSFDNLLEILPRPSSDAGVKRFEIKTIMEIDREVNPRIETNVICTETSNTNSVKNSEAPLVVVILDENDNAPEMTVEGRTIAIENSVIGTTIFTVKATDPDEGENGRISFSLDQSDPFSLQYLKIDETDGKVKVNGKIDCEASSTQLTELQIVVTARDNGKPPKSTELKLVVKVQDVNDNIPTFYNILSPFTISENSPKNTFIGEIEVQDKDHSDIVSLRILNPNQVYLPFTITTRDNKIFYLNSSNSIDREKHPTFRFQIVAVDGNTKFAHSVQETIEVRVTDVNDNSPTIIFPTQNNASVHRISYLEAPHYKLLLVSANDQDELPDNNRLEFIIEDESKIFAITNKDPYIMTQRDMTKNDIGDKRIRIVVRDHGTPRLESSVVINIVIDHSQPKSFSAQNHNRLSGGGDPSGETLLTGNSEIVLYVVVVIIVFVIIVIITIFAFYLRRCKVENRGPYSTIFTCCQSTQPSPIVSKAMISSPTQRFNLHDEMMIYNNHQNSMLNNDKLIENSNFTDNWSPNEKIQAYTNPRAAYNKLANPNLYYVNPQHTYQIIEDCNVWPRNNDMSVKRVPSFQVRGKNMGQCKSELNINRWGSDRNEFFSLDNTPGAPWITSQTPLPTRSRHLANTILDTDSFDNFAVALPIDESTFV